MRTASPDKSKSPKKNGEFSPIVPKVLDPTDISHSKTIDTLLNQAPKVVYSEKLNEVVVAGYMNRDENYQLKVYDGKTLAQKGEKEAHKHRIIRMVLLPDELIATLSVDKTIKIWRLVGLALVHEIQLKYDPCDICIHSNLKAAIIVGKSPNISCYNISSGSFIAEIQGGSTEGYNACAYLPSKNTLVASCINKHTIHVIDCNTSVVLSTLEGGKDLTQVIGIQLIESVCQVVSASDNGICVWDLYDAANPKKLLEFAPPINKITHFTVLPDEDAVLLTYNSPRIDIYRLSTGILLKSLPTKLQKCYDIAYAQAIDRIFVVDSQEGALGVLTKHAKSKKAQCHGCSIF